MTVEHIPAGDTGVVVELADLARTREPDPFGLRLEDLPVKERPAWPRKGLA